MFRYYFRSAPPKQVVGGTNSDLAHDKTAQKSISIATNCDQQHSLLLDSRMNKHSEFGGLVGRYGLPQHPAKARMDHLDGGAGDEFSQCATSTTTCVPNNMLLNEKLRKNAGTLNEISLKPLSIIDGAVKEKKPVTFDKAMRHETKRAGGKRTSVINVVYVVRRPGCADCREHGEQLAELAMEFRNLALWAIVKETGAEEEGIVSFVENHFNFNVYKDEQWMTYKAMGNRKLSAVKIMRGVLGAKRRWADKAIQNRAKGGDHITQGGILFFKRGDLRYAYEEEFGKELNVTDIRDTIKALQEEGDEDDDCTCSEVSVSEAEASSSRLQL